MAFTERDVKALKWEGKDRLISVGDGLFLNLRKSSKTWIIRRRHNGKMQVATLGKHPTVSAKQARAEALARALQDVPSNMTVEELSKKYYEEVVEAEHKRPELARGYIDRAIVPGMGNRRVVEISPVEVAKVIHDYRARGARTADQLRSQIRALFTFAIETGIRPDNPAAGLTRRVAGYRPRPRERVLSDAELRALWQEKNHNARVLRFLVVTGLRISEAQKGHREGGRWIVPASISKNGRKHWAHLTDAAKEQLPLPSSTPTNIQAWLRRWCVKQEEIDPAFTPHDCRRTAATRMADAGVEPFIVERVLNHTLGGVMAVYNRAEYAKERIAAAEALEREILEVAS
ncbi:MAG: tyrosine-type recombinase/integrase [Pseudomonadota bacterium]|nr:tyrosine-type recombinase/integrase [Pseudomonadota bacterium]